MPDTKTFDVTFKTLRGILKPHSKRLLVQADTPKLYTLALRDVTDRVGRPMFFGAVRKGKAYVSYHLMAFYGNPGLVKKLSPGLRKRMQGKTCFNFTTIHPDHVKELTAVTTRSVARFNKKTLEKILPW
jgi:hypothetical protein